MSGSIVAVVVTYNRLEALKLTVKRLSEEKLDHIIVVNNASSDGTFEFLEASSKSKLHNVHLNENLGGAGGFEAGLREALFQFDPDWVVVMDDDAYPRKGAIDKFCKQRHESYQVVASAVRLPNNEIAEMNRPWLNPFGSMRTFLKTAFRGRSGFHIENSAYESQELMSIDGASFVGLFIHREVLKQHALPDGRLFIYGDDVLYTLALRSAGVAIGFDPQIHFEHNCNTGSTKGIFVPLWKNYFRFRNQIMVYRKVSGPLIIVPILAVKILNWIFLSLTLERPQRKKYLRLLCIAVIDSAKGNLDRDFNDIVGL